MQIFSKPVQEDFNLEAEDPSLAVQTIVTVGHKLKSPGHDPHNASGPHHMLLDIPKAQTKSKQA